ncbi:uncharacterized protein LOC101218481 isoform X1 [Cucumis sativus]|uniref:uncharacterized protein LOC101218481 isoform X1 n=1 Tax=Cucumis sativus TaxID=3659 RepID=UPI0002B4C058|nr:uncharacterized protein LOC101218481 isoform X1 [Cucumis sativus]KAE8648048.1 hypothetical protein Csa_005891 [Cucumis sativus]
MDDRRDSTIVSDLFFSTPRSKTKTLGEKRSSSSNFEEQCGSDLKRIKLPDSGSMCGSQAINICQESCLKTVEVSEECQTVEEERLQAIELSKKLDVFATLAEKAGDTNASSGVLDLNTEICVARSSGSDNMDLVNISKKQHRLRNDNGSHVAARGIDLDLNIEDVSTSVNLETAHPPKNYNELKSQKSSECASSTGPLGEKDPLSIWKEMKQNGFLSASHGFISASHGGIPAPKQRGRKSKNDAFKKKMEIAKREKKLELAKKEQIDRFTKIAAPSGLLTELNPGIINHVRNRKQVHSIIEAIVRSEKQENERIANKLEKRHAAKAGAKRDLENTHDPDINVYGSSQGYGSSNNISAVRQKRGCSLTRSLITEAEVVDRGQIMLDRATGKNYASQLNTTNDKETLALELSSSHAVSENACPVSNDEEENLTCISSLSLKAATVASQWLDLIHQDIKGRLSALRRSKKRVRAVISTELPFLISKEFPSNEENDPFVSKSSQEESSVVSLADIHQARWTKLFDQMDKALAEEEKQLESWLNQVKEMQIHCDQGLSHAQSNAAFGSQQLGENDLRTRKMNSTERALAVGAAAASIYSTCNFLFSENVSCF